MSTLLTIVQFLWKYYRLFSVIYVAINITAVLFPFVPVSFLIFFLLRNLNFQWCFGFLPYELLMSVFNTVTLDPHTVQSLKLLSLFLSVTNCLWVDIPKISSHFLLIIFIKIFKKCLLKTKTNFTF